ncbi:MAG: TolC family protein [Bacteroidetes bacterium]|nr:TolC family protein [Bacteroidota bacterium]
MRHYLLPFLLILALNSSAQDNDVWSLQRAVQYALEHNISLQQNELNVRLAKLTYQQSVLGQLPNINGSSSYGRSYGRSVDPTTNQFVSGTSYDYIGLNGNADVLLFGWFQKRNSITRNNLSYQAAEADYNQLRNDISLNVATGYLRALLAQEQVTVSRQQVELSTVQLSQTRKFAETGRVPELNVAQLEAQLANDSASLIAAISEYTSAVLDIKALLNLDFTTPFNIQVPVVNVSDQTVALSMLPEDIYNEAVKHYGTVISSTLKLKAAQRDLWVTRGSLLPQLGAGGQIGTNWSSTVKDVTGYTITGYTPNGSYADVNVAGVGSGQFPIYQPIVQYQTADVSRRTQFDRNFRQTISLNLNVPIFNGWQTQTAVSRARINKISSELSKYQAELKLRQDVYKAYNDAKNAVQKYAAAVRASEASTRAFDYAQKRYDLGLTNTVEYLTTKNTYYSSSSNLAKAKYDLIFKLKVIDYYLGKELKL